MKRLVILISFVLSLMIVPGISASEFDGLDYTLNYTQLTGDFAIVVDFNGQTFDYSVSFTVAENMPSTMIG